MSPTVIAAIVSILAIALPHLGITIGTAQLTTIIQATVVLASSIVVWYREVTGNNLTFLGHAR